MSIRVMTQVWEKAPYTEGTLLALLALADWADDDGICWPKVDQLALKARLSRSGAEFCLRKLREDKAIIVAKESSGPGKPKVYQLGPQYLRVSAEKTLSRTEKTLSKPSRYKEEPSLEATVSKPGVCSKCDGRQILLNSGQKPHLLPCPECNPGNQAQISGVGV